MTVHAPAPIQEEVMSDTTAMMARLNEIAEFLDGSAPMDGHWFGDETDLPMVAGRQARYWWRTPLRELVGDLRAALAGQADAWRPIETAPRDAQCVFWIVPKSADETYHDTSGNPILSTSKPYMILGKYGDWGSLMKAAAWHPPQEIKPPTDDELAALIAPASIGAEAQEGK